MAPNFLLGFSNQELISDANHINQTICHITAMSKYSIKLKFCFSVLSHTSPSLLGLFKYHPVFWLNI